MWIGATDVIRRLSAFGIEFHIVLVPEVILVGQPSSRVGVAAQKFLEFGLVRSCFEFGSSIRICDRVRWVTKILWI